MPYKIIQDIKGLEQRLRAAIAKRQDTDDLSELLQELLLIQEKMDAQLLSEHVRIRNELALRDRALDAAPTHFSIAKYLGEAESIFIYVNRAFAEAHGCSREEVIGRSSKELSPFDWTAERYAEIRSMIASGKEARAEGQIRRKDGSTFWAGITIIPVHDSNGVLTHTVSVSADITARRENERKQRELQQQLLDEMQQREQIAIELRLAQKLESVGRLAAGVAHEINTPIQFVNDSLHFLGSAFDDIGKLLKTYESELHNVTKGSSLSDCLKNIEAAKAAADLEFLQAEVPRALERTFDGANRVSSIVRAIKEFAHPDATEHSPADINRALQNTLIMAANEYKYLAKVSTQFSALPLVTCNIGQLNQVFLNLIVNAAHAIHDAGKDATNGVISIKTEIADDRVEITISDNGCGIAQEHLDKIYDPFFTTKEVGRGTGQGLAITRSIVMDKHRGDIRVNSTVGAGTQFTLCLPANDPGSDSLEALS